MKKYLIVILFLFIASNLMSQNKSEIDSLRELLKSAEIDSVKADLYNELSYKFFNSGKDTSKIFAQYGMYLSKKNNYQRGIAESFLNYGNISIVEGNLNKAIDHFLKAMEIFQKINDSTGITKTYLGLGLTHYYLKNLENSLEYNNLALTVSKKINKKHIDKIYNNIGLVYMSLNQNDSALYYFEKSIINAIEINNKNVAVYSYGNIASIYLSQEKFKKALDIYKKVGELCEELDDKIGLSVSYGNISVVYIKSAAHTNIDSEKKNYYKLSVKNAHNALKYAEEVNSLTHMNFAYNYLVFSYEKLNDYKNAFEYAEKYISSSDSLYNTNKVKEVEKLERKFKNEQQKNKIKNITKEKELKEDIINKQDQIILIGISASFLILILLIFVFILYRNKKIANNLLNRRNEDIKNQRSEIAVQRDNLSELAFELKKLSKTKNNFFSILAHDLKNPFQSILGFSELLQEQALNNNFSNTKKYAEYIYDTTNKTYTLLENLLNWARVQTGVLKYNPEKLILSNLINESIEINKPAVESKDISVINNADETNKIFADKYMVSTILRNLISNAVKYTKIGGKIYIDTKIKDNILDLSVQDTGIGIKEENISRIFKLDQIFLTSGTDKEAGTGLGLIVCKEFAKKNKGELKVQSKVGEGCTFILTVPTIKETL